MVNENLANLEHVLNYLPLLLIVQEATVVILVHAWHLALGTYYYFDNQFLW